jgi:hypothetical protein
MAVLEQFRAHFGSDRRNLVASHSNCANIKKAHTLLLYYPLLLVHFQMCKISEWPETLVVILNVKADDNRKGMPLY